MIFTLWDEANQCWAHSSEYEVAVVSIDTCEEIGIDYIKYGELVKKHNGYEFGGGEYGFKNQEDAIKCRDEILKYFYEIKTK